MSSLARGCSGVIECKIEKLLKEYHVTYQMEGCNKYINKILFSVIFRAEIFSTDQDEIL
jgi:galactitol-specific phosphotransferase system IIB component